MASVRIGDPGSLDGMRYIDHATVGADWQYFPVNLHLLEPLRRQLLAVVASGHAWKPPIQDHHLVYGVGEYLADVLGYQPPVGVLVHRDAALGYHTDTQNPTRCWNATLFLRDGCDGGELVVPDRKIAFHSGDGWCVGFDGQLVHGVTPLTLESRQGAHRIAVTFYSPRSA